MKESYVTGAELRRISDSDGTTVERWREWRRLRLDRRLLRERPVTVIEMDGSYVTNISLTSPGRTRGLKDEVRKYIQLIQNREDVGDGGKVQVPCIGSTKTLTLYSTVGSLGYVLGYVL